ncbi:hypothetical protein CL619_02125 [archaeon]|nr:hypothetical protein [archaeon]|tara:strand:- start:337 stop:1575 length:1239 start_codon:yes stop_codon:yes gene_type:complete
MGIEEQKQGSMDKSKLQSITYVCPTNCVRRPIAELSSLLAEKRYSVNVAFPFSEACPTDQWAPNKKLADSKKVKSILIPSYYLASLRYNIPKPWKLFGILRKMFQSDIVHMWEYWYPINVVIIFYALLTGQRHKLIMTTDGFVGYSYKPQEPRWLVPAFCLYTRTLGWFLFRIPGSLTTYGKAMLSFAKEARVPKSKLEVLGTGIHLDRFQSVSSKEVDKLREEFNLNLNDQVLLYLGMLSERKGIATIVEITKRLLKSGWRGKAIIVGDAHGNEDFLSLVPLELKERIIFPGGRSDVPTFMNLADCLLIPSEGEGLPGVVMEAMAAGTACVATNEGCTPDLIDNAVNGFLVQYGDVDGYEKAVRSVLKDPKKYGNAAFLKIKEFSWEEVVKKYENLYYKIFDKPVGDSNAR